VISSFIMTQDTENQILIELRSVSDRLDHLSGDVEKLSGDVEKLSGDVDKAVTDTEKFNEKFSEYRQATQWVVQLAFGLIASATIITIVSTIFKR
jgi:predicted  nucleic acid-binding Zn-ribbon protein